MTRHEVHIQAIIFDRVLTVWADSHDEAVDLARGQAYYILERDHELHPMDYNTQVLRVSTDL